MSSKVKFKKGDAITYKTDAGVLTHAIIRFVRSARLGDSKVSWMIVKITSTGATVNLTADEDSLVRQEVKLA
jgi:hypothetical protein